MPLPKPVTRKHVHTRAIDYRAYQREDGLWDIEAHMTDTKTYEFRNKWRGQVPVGVPMHEMLLRVTIDDTFQIQDIEAATENSPFEMCPNITPNYKSLIGIRMGVGWRKAIRMKVGGIQGCTHITELLFPMATVAMQTLWPFLSKRKKAAAKTNGDAHIANESQPRKRPQVLNTCHAWATDSPVVKENATQWYTGKSQSS
ncbi:MAG: DUF2889 domain-containing protein [Gammaproteobacteria bacterium]|nr:DUF2889 domain-containing protein [Gammaproteobacteria bacterium]